MAEIEIWDSAYQMIRLYQHGAERAAAGRADAMIDKGDVNGFRIWMRVAGTIRDLKHEMGFHTAH